MTSVLTSPLKYNSAIAHRLNKTSKWPPFYYSVKFIHKTAWQEIKVCTIFEKQTAWNLYTK